jgi:hypothetical protein
MASILTTVPRKRTKFPPPGAFLQHRVITGDNWWSLATKYGRTDPWDIIEFNFRTRDAREVNWYMESYLGCHFAASDGKNFRFDSSDEPGLVYIPPSTWTRSEDLRLRSMVASALSGPVIARVNVHHVGRAIFGTTLAAVAIRVLEGEIDVVVDSTMRTWEAEYDSGTDILHLGFANASSTTRKALIVHEAVHAALDIKAVSGMTIAESESLAYVVQSFYVREHTLEPDVYRLTDPEDGSDRNPWRDRVYELAWDMAATLSKGTQPTSIEWLALDHAVRRHPKYKGFAGNMAAFDGI